MRIIASWSGSHGPPNTSTRARSVAPAGELPSVSTPCLPRPATGDAPQNRWPPRSWVETRTWSSFKQATRSNDLNQRLDRNHPIQVLGREIEVTGAERLDHPRDLVDRCPPARGPPASAVHDPLCPVRLIGIAQPAKVPL